MLQIIDILDYAVTLQRLTVSITILLHSCFGLFVQEKRNCMKSWVTLMEELKFSV
jgi:hypothetical protein